MTVVAVIPARFKSSRFPGKPLVGLLGKPMVVWVAQAAAQAIGRDSVFVATDDGRIANAVEQYGFRALMTSENALTGTDRVWEASSSVSADVYVNVQGDEPAVNPADILKIGQAKERFPGEVINGMCPMAESESPADCNVPKVVTAEDNRLLYASRLPVPGRKAGCSAPAAYWKQVCIYAYTREELDRFGRLGRKSRVESIEDIEILRFLDLGIGVRMIETSAGSLAVDVAEDVNKVEAVLKAMYGARPGN